MVPEPPCGPISYLSTKPIQVERMVKEPLGLLVSHFSFYSVQDKATVIILYVMLFILGIFMKIHQVLNCVCCCGPRGLPRGER